MYTYHQKDPNSRTTIIVNILNSYVFHALTVNRYVFPIGLS